jgi:hypothetical protein
MLFANEEKGGKKKEVRFLTDKNFRYFALKTVKWPRQTHYALASFVTAHSRIAIAKHIRNAKGVAYTDTDSIHAACDSQFQTGEALGDLSLKIPKMRGEYFAAKLYRLETEGGYIQKSKGFEVDENVFQDIVSGKPVVREQMRLAKSMAKSGSLEAKRPVMTRTWKGMSLKRYVDKRTGDTRPWTVSELRLNKHLTSKSFNLR